MDELETRKLRYIKAVSETHVAPENHVKVVSIVREICNARVKTICLTYLKISKNWRLGTGNGSQIRDREGGFMNAIAGIFSGIIGATFAKLLM